MLSLQGLFDFRSNINWFYSSQLSSQLPILSHVIFERKTSRFFFASGSKVNLSIETMTEKENVFRSRSIEYQCQMIVHHVCHVMSVYLHQLIHWVVVGVE